MLLSTCCPYKRASDPLRCVWLFVKSRIGCRCAGASCGSREPGVPILEARLHCLRQHGIDLVSAPGDMIGLSDQTRRQGRREQQDPSSQPLRPLRNVLPRPARAVARGRPVTNAWRSSACTMHRVEMLMLLVHQVYIREAASVDRYPIVSDQTSRLFGRGVLMASRSLLQCSTEAHRCPDIALPLR